MIKGAVLFLALCVALSCGRGMKKRQTGGEQQQPQPVVPAAPPPRPPPPPPLEPIQPPPPPQQPSQEQFQKQGGSEQFQPPPGPLQSQIALQQQPESGAPLLQVPQVPQVPQLPQAQSQPLIIPRRNFAAGFEPKPIPPDPGLNQPKIQWIGDERQGDRAAPVEQQNLPVIRPQEEQQAAKGDQVKLLPLQPFPPQEQQKQPPLNGQSPQPADGSSASEPELRQRIQQQAIHSQVNTAGRDREAFLAKLNVTGDQTAAREFIRQLKNLTDFFDREPFANANLMSALVNTELQLAVDNWILNEEVAGQLAATFKIPRESTGAAFVLTAADVDEMRVAGNNPTAAKTFIVEIRELIWTKIDQQYRITTDLLATLSDSLLRLLVGNGIVKQKFADDISTYFYRANNRRIKLF